MGRRITGLHPAGTGFDAGITLYLRIPANVAMHSGTKVATHSGMMIATDSGPRLPPSYRSEATLAFMTQDIINRSIRKNTPEVREKLGRPY
jgi:hypothetical protein